MIEKRALSPIVATILLILLTVGTVAIISEFVVPFTRDNLDESKTCFDYKEYYKFDESLGYNCFDSQGIHFSLKANGDKTLAEGIDGFDIVYTDSSTGSSINFEVLDGQNGGCSEGNVSAYNTCASTLKVAKNGEIRTYTYHTSGANNNNLKRLRVYPSLANRNSCGDESDSITLVACGAP